MDIKTITNERIVQTSCIRTGSTLLYNVLQGFFYPEENYHYIGRLAKFFTNRLPFDRAFVLKTHNTNIESMIKFNPNYDLYFVTSSREGFGKIDLKHPRLLEIKYEELVQTDTNSVENIVENIAAKCRVFLPPFLVENMDINASIDRVVRMNKRVEEIKDKPFRFCDKMYGVHGSHRNRT
jgi:hypothetical protein